MSITDELRGWMKGTTLSSWTAEHLLAIADRIDAEHESACAEAYGNGVMSVPIALDESAWVELPKDADGEYTNAGDEMFWKEDGDSAGRVTAIGVGQRAGWVWTLLDGCNVSTGHEAFRLRHHHAPTVEDVLRELVGKAQVLSNVDDEDELVAEYAKRLTLAGDADATHGRQSDADLAAENAKLRWLVEDMLSCIETQIAFDRTPEKWMYKEFAGRAQELGVEEEKDG